MTPHKSGNRGTLILEKVFNGVRLRRASGTKDEAVLKRLKIMLDDLDQAGRSDIIRAIRDGHMKPLEVYASYRRFGLSKLPMPEQMQPLQTAFPEWLKTLQCGDSHRRNCGYAFNGLQVNKHHVVSDLPGLLREYRKTAKPVMFRIARAACQAFMRDTFGKYHDLWRDVSAVELLKVERRPGKPQTPEQAEAVRDALGADYGAVWWSMCVTGMGPKELWGQWEVEQDRILIHGTKRESRERVIPRIEIPQRPQYQYQAFRKALSKHGLAPYDGRRTFAKWLEESGVPRTRRRIYLGHKTRDVTDLYEDSEIDTDRLREDATAVRKYLRKHLKTGLRIA
jgi:hypothetical protein